MMRATSDAFGAVVAASHDAAFRCDVLFNREIIAEGLQVVAGTVTLNRRNEIYSSARIQLAEPERLPITSADILSPYGFEVRLWRGVVVNGTDELLPLGTFPIQRSDIQGVSLLTDLTVEDRARLAADADFEDVTVIAAGTNYATAIETLISDAVGGLTYNFPATTFTTPKLVIIRKSGRWKRARQMARSIGMELRFDGLGQPEMRPEPTFADPAVFDVAKFVNLVDGALSLDRTPAFNRVIAIGRNASNSAEVTATATDDDPESPTFYSDTGFGKRVYFDESPLYGATPQAQAGADATLAANLGVARTYRAAAIPDPRPEPSDVAYGYHPELGVDGKFIVDSQQIDMAPEGAMLMSLRGEKDGAPT